VSRHPESATQRITGRLGANILSKVNPKSGKVPVKTKSAQRKKHNRLESV